MHTSGPVGINGHCCGFLNNTVKPTGVKQHSGRNCMGWGRRGGDEAPEGGNCRKNLDLDASEQAHVAPKQDLANNKRHQSACGSGFNLDPRTP